MTSPLRILLLEDNPHDAELVTELLEADHMACEVIRAETRAEFEGAIESGGIDLILADYQLPSFDGLSALKLALSERPDLPFIFVSGTLGEEVAIEALKIGATDYVLKTRISRLVPAVRRAQREARERADRRWAEYLTGQVFESSPDGMCIVGRDYRFQRVNPVYARVWGIPAERIVGKHVADLLGTKVFEQTLKPSYDRCFEGDEVRYVEWVSYPIGRRYLVLTYSPLRPVSDRVEVALAVTRDLTDHMLASEALRAAQAELAHVNRVATMGQLAASIAHEVNQPITGAIASAQAAKRWLDRPDLDAARQAIENVIRDGARAGDILHRIRAMIQKAPSRKGRFDLNEAVRDVIVLTSSEVLRHGVSVQTELATGLPSVEGDRVQLQQVILNLIMNAIEAMSGVHEGARELLISTETDASGDVLVVVRDSGLGLDPQSADRLFETFYTTKSDGMGMGLSICRSIVEAHGGRLWASANEPWGAVFHFTVPSEWDNSVPAEHAGGTRP